MQTNGHSPQSEPRVDIRRERKYRPTEAGTFHILTTLTAPDMPARDRQRPPLDLSFVVDRSGSMAGGALELARQGVEHALRLLDERDSVSVVVYDAEIDTLLTQHLCDSEARAKATRRLRRVQPRGSTALADGWLTGCNELAPLSDGSRVIRHDGGRPLCRALLLTDGLANVGMTDSGELSHHAAQLRQRGITTTTFGVGHGYDEDLLANMADSGGGHFHHIPHAVAIPQVFAGELGEMLQIALRDVTIALRVPTTWSLHLLNDLPIERDGDWIVLRIGELFANDSQSHVWAVDLPPMGHGRHETFEVRLRWSDADGQDRFDQRLSHTVEASHSPGHLDDRVSEALARQLAARARTEAVRYNRSGDYASAQTVLQDAMASMPRTASAAAELHDLSMDVDSLTRQAAPATLKQQFSKARHAQRSRKDYSQDTTPRSSMS